MERPENEGDQAKDVKMHGAGGVPAADENEQADKQIEQAYDAQVILGRKRLFRRRCEEWCFEFLTTARKLVAHLGPETRAVQTASNLRRPCDLGGIDRQQNVARADSGAGCGRIGSNAAGLNTVVRVEPGHSVVYHFKTAALVEVN